jgi:preprotein translocase subunit SecE
MIEKLNKYWKETLAELRKMSWPTRQELTGSTIVVVVVSLIVAVFIGVVDRVLVLIVKTIFGTGVGG